MTGNIIAGNASVNILQSLSQQNGAVKGVQSQVTALQYQQIAASQLGLITVAHASGGQAITQSVAKIVINTLDFGQWNTSDSSVIMISCLPVV